MSVPPPEYPETARRARLQGRVVVRAVIGADGHVHDAEVVAAPNPLLSEAAHRAILGWVYQPARLDGRAVACFLEVTLDFRIE